MGTTLRAFVETGLPDLPAPGHLRAADAQTLFEYLRDHQWELGAFIDLHTATVCAGSTGAVDILVVDTVGRFTEYGEDALQRLTAGSTRPTGPLLVASPTHRWGILAAMELHASLCGTMVSYEDLSRSYGLPSGGICRPIRIMRLCKSFMTNGRLICNRAIRTRAQCWHERPVRPHHRASCCCGSLINGSLIKKATRFFGDLFCLHFSVSIH